MITGTPGAGKTFFAKEIAKTFSLDHIDISKYIKDNELYTNHDDKFDTFLFEEETVRKSLKLYLKNKKNFIIDTHSPELLNFVDFNFIYVLKISTDELYTRLRSRGYSAKKIKENINCEIFEIIEDSLSENNMPFYLVGSEDGFLTKNDVFNDIERAVNTTR